jgi:hypothetical protein
LNGINGQSQPPSSLRKKKGGVSETDRWLALAIHTVHVNMNSFEEKIQILKYRQVDLRDQFIVDEFPRKKIKKEFPRKKRKIFRGPRVWATTIVRPSVGENGSAPFSVKLLSRAL